ncbi:hypothetical protein OG564_12210 [Streptomyces sp. NBC_01280]|uniref:hypothetical protein n=1 Tax=Streptomyces sp. NBC_01280 TaxID=2903810 RepID=UPI002E32809A|nr:hypothetical protein [Streptomyces sp. NBC_01280]
MLDAFEPAEPAATAGPSNLVATVVTRDTAALYAYISAAQAISRCSESARPPQHGTVGEADARGVVLDVDAEGARADVLVTSAMQHSLSHGAAHTLASGGARAPGGVIPEHALRVAFASGLNTASVVAGCAALVAGVLVLALVRAPRAAHRAPGATTSAAAGDSRGPSVEKSEATSPPKNPAADPR